MYALEERRTSTSGVASTFDPGEIARRKFFLTTFWYSTQRNFGEVSAVEGAADRVRAVRKNYIVGQT